MLRPKKAVWYGAPCDELGLSPIPMDPHVCCRGLQRYGLKNQCGMEHLVMNKFCLPYLDEQGLSPIPMDPHVYRRGLQRCGLKKQCGMEHLVMNKVCIPFILTHTSIVEASNTMAL